MSPAVDDAGFGWQVAAPRVTRTGPVLAAPVVVPDPALGVRASAGRPTGGAVGGAAVGAVAGAARDATGTALVPAPRRGLPTYADVVAAAGRLDPVAHRTPVLTSRVLDGMVGAQVKLKCENFQRAGAFAFRGAYNTLARLGPAERAAGVVAYSTGNHAQAVALAASLLRIPALVVLPRDAAPAALAATLGYGGRVVQHDLSDGDPATIAADVAAEHGAVVVPPADHPDVIAGQGTATREFFGAVSALEALFVPFGGGGLLAGACIAATALAPGCEVVGVEPADGARAGLLGNWTFPIIRDGVSQILSVTDAEAVDTMRLLHTYLKIVVEPAGCLALAAVRKLAREQPAQIFGRRIGVVLSGGNVDLSTLAELLAGPAGQ